MCRALLRLTDRHNANVLDPVNHFLDGHPNICLREPLEYVPFFNLVRHVHLAITDSGGVQEEDRRWGNQFW